MASNSHHREEGRGEWVAYTLCAKGLAKEQVMEKQSTRSGEQGQGIIEYALILVLVAMVVVLILVIFGPQIGDAFSNITHGL
jgi:pilus assembly protein Flp/PilA